MRLSIDCDGSTCNIDIFDINTTLCVGGPNYGRYAKSERFLLCDYLSMDIYETGEGLAGTLKVYFNRYEWFIKIDGLIYTDELFLKAVKDYFLFIGIPEKFLCGIGYSEKGMQEDYYVSFDINHDFITVLVDVFVEKGFIDVDVGLLIVMMESII